MAVIGIPGFFAFMVLYIVFFYIFVRYMSTCLHVAASKVLEDAVREEHFEEALAIIKKMGELIF